MEYSQLVHLYENLGSTSKRLEKTYFLAEALKQADKESLPMLVLLVQGRVFPGWDESKIGIASQLMVKAISAASGTSPSAVEAEWKNSGDLGIAAERLLNKKRQRALLSSELTVAKVFDNIRSLAGIEGKGSVERKLQLIAELISSASALEARYITKTVLEQLRVGVSSGTLRDALVWAFFPKIIGILHRCPHCSSLVPNTKSCVACRAAMAGKFSEAKEPKAIEVNSLNEADYNRISNRDILMPGDEALARGIYNHFLDSVQQAYDMSNDFAVVAEKLAASGPAGLKDTRLSVGAPIKVMLGPKVDTVGEAFKVTGRPAAVEFKYDGFRMQIHKDKGMFRVFTRRLENVTAQFPEVEGYVNKHVRGTSFILDSEAVGYDPKTLRYKPFQEISQRIKRKYDIKKLAEELPVELNVFDIMYYNRKNMISEPFKKRRELLEGIITPEKRQLVLAQQEVTSDEGEAEAFFKKSLAHGNEGIMFKNLNAPYKPGARVGYMVKYKSAMETLDLVIVGAEWGEGKRARWLSSFTLACRSGRGFLEIGRVGTGIKEKEEQGVSFEQLTKMLKPLVTSEKGRYVTVNPQVVVEVKFEEIQASPTYSSGFALRFPRLLQLRDDRSASDTTELSYIKKLYLSQRHRAGKKSDS
ncbi:hypothetical protein COT48_06375 [Candidatus Woesearchaeota archaeon CG08_land_8_20_14_0_20_47_9]|nr:MAG: hypothetical protein COT48_06375 [Candidatus Woesearchaeota archaeon CG08_land_8_20_14_0_20_47_9]